MKRFIIRFVLALLLALMLTIPVLADEQEADNLSSTKLVTDSSGFPSSVSYLFDETRGKGKKTEDTAFLTLSHDGGIGSLYLIFGESYGTYEITRMDSGERKTVGQQGYVHDFVDLVALFGSAPKSVTVTFRNGPAALYELEVYGPGTVPDSVQKWNAPVDGKTDLVLFATHSDDDQLFFAGVLPYYGVERGMQVQVVYLTNHFNSQSYRIHEALDGLWAVGVRSYPVFGPYPDFADWSTIDGAFSEFVEWGYDRKQMTGFVVEQLRRFKPLVAVGHDFDGEYGHIQHKVYARLLADALELSNDPLSYPETAEKYGVWDVPKTYIHLYEKNRIEMDWDQPMESFDGMTPYEVARDLGFECHGSQHKDWKNYFNANKASRLVWMSPCDYGLYRTTVGDDVEKNDFFENLISYAEQDRIAAEEAARIAAEEAAKKAEEEARKAEEERRLEEERLAQEASRAEEERVQEEIRQKEAQAIARRERQTRISLTLILCLILAAVSAGAALLILCLKKRRKKAK